MIAGVIDVVQFENRAALDYASPLCFSPAASVQKPVLDARITAKTGAAHHPAIWSDALLQIHIARWPPEALLSIILVA